MLEKVVRDFCGENHYEVLENYKTHPIFGETVTTLAIVVKPDHNVFEVLAQLTSYLGTRGFDDQLWGQITNELEGPAVAEFGPNLLIYFPYMDYQSPNK